MTSDFCVAVHALVYLNHKACVLSSEELAQNICTNPARVRKVMAKLKKSGFLETREGSSGGYRFERDPAGVTLSALAEALDIRFVDTAWKSGDKELECLIASGMGDLMADVFDDLNTRCMERLGQITIADLDEKIFIKPVSGADNK